VPRLWEHRYCEYYLFARKRPAWRTSLSGVPAKAWDYKLGNRSALEWVLDRYKEKKPSDPTIAEKFNTYRFADCKEEVIELLKKICTVSIETMKIIEQMREQS
jgi:predicted helicase